METHQDTNRENCEEHEWQPKNRLWNCSAHCPASQAEAQRSHVYLLSLPSASIATTWIQTEMGWKKITFHCHFRADRTNEWPDHVNSKIQESGVPRDEKGTKWNWRNKPACSWFTQNNKGAILAHCHTIRKPQILHEHSSLLCCWIVFDESPCCVSFQNRKKKLPAITFPKLLLT